MGILVAGILLITTFLVVSSLMFGTFLSTSFDQAESLKEVAELNKRLASSGLNITSASVHSPSTGEISVKMDNTGSESVASFGQMDVIVSYTDTGDLTNLTYLDYTSGALGNNQWTVSATGVTPNVFNPQVWDSDEELTIDIKVDPAVKSGTSGLVVVGTPTGVTDQSNLTNP